MGKSDGVFGSTHISTIKADLIPFLQPAFAGWSFGLYAVWSTLLAFENAADNDATCQALSEARAQIERHAMTLPTHCALDVWKLIAITTDKPDEDRIDYTADAVIVRAHREVDGSTKDALFDQVACLVDAFAG